MKRSLNNKERANLKILKEKGRRGKEIFKESIIESEYREIGYLDYYNKLDFEVVNEDVPICEKCDNNFRYIGLQKGSQRVAISHCDNCGNEFEF